MDDVIAKMQARIKKIVDNSIASDLKTAAALAANVIPPSKYVPPEPRYCPHCGEELGEDYD